LHIESGARSDVGRVRKNNEDSFRAEPALELFVLSDGMGGQASGEVASALAVETVVDYCRAAAGENGAPEFCGEPTPGLSERTNRLASAIRLANRKIFESGANDPARKGMGATIVACWIADRRLSLAHVGDSRVYLLRSGSFEQLTADHSLVADLVRSGILTPQQAEVSEQQSILTRALGTQPAVQVDADEQLLLLGDVLLLCSDGLSRTVTNPEIASTLETHPDPQKAVDRLIELANENGGEDNVTAIVVRVAPDPKGFLARWRRWWNGEK
jgi:protein phosphatase